MDRRRFIRRAVSAVAMMALVLTGCGVPPADAPVAVDRSQGQNQVVEEVAQPLEEDWGVACPAGIVNDPYPGHCKRYVDANGNGVCDLSEPGSGDYRPRT